MVIVQGAAQLLRVLLHCLFPHVTLLAPVCLGISVVQAVLEVAHISHHTVSVLVARCAKAWTRYTLWIPESTRSAVFKELAIPSPFRVLDQELAVAIVQARVVAWHGIGGNQCLVC